MAGEYQKTETLTQKVNQRLQMLSRDLNISLSWLQVNEFKVYCFRSIQTDASPIALDKSIYYTCSRTTKKKMDSQAQRKKIYFSFSRLRYGPFAFDPRRFRHHSTN